MATEREWLVSQGLAKMGRGRYSAEAKEALVKAKDGGMTFDLTAAEKAKLERANKPKKIRSVKQVVSKEVRPSQDSYDAKAVRAWGEQTGAIEKGKRGKLPTALINAYLAANTTQKKVVVRKNSTPRIKVREESVGWAIAKRGPKDHAYISEPAVAVTTCGGCGKGVSYCGCTNGPKAPKYLGGELLLLTRPVK